MKPSASFRTRRATGEDAALLAELGARTFRDAYADSNDPEHLEQHIAQEFTPEQLARKLADPRSTFLIGYDTAYSQERPVGYVQLVAGRPNPAVQGSRPLELAQIYVEHDAIGSGYGAALMRSSIDAAREAGCETLWLGVWERNDRARRFYERCGFRKVGQQEFVLGGEVQTDLVMERSLGLPGERCETR